MSGSMPPGPNPLAAPAPTQASPAARPPDDPMMQHARMWQYVNGMKPDEIASKAKEIDGTLPLLGALAGNDRVTAKNVIKAAADAAATGKITPSQAVKFISGMPDDHTKLQSWLKGIYAANMGALVHMKAALMAQRPGAPVAGPGMAPAAPAAMPAAPIGGMPPGAIR